MRALLARAPTERAWRRRCWPILVRSRGSRTRLAGRGDDVRRCGDSNRDVTGDGQRRRVPMTATNGTVAGNGTEVGGGGSGDVMEVLVGLELEGVFRTVEGFL